MIQRIQSIWLLLAAIVMMLTFKWPFATGTTMVNNVLSPTKVYANTTVPTLLLAVAFIIINLVVIFLYNNRKLQMKVLAAAIVLGLLNVYLLYNNTSSLIDYTYSLSAVLPLFATGFVISAVHAIWQDDKKVTEMNSDRLR